MITFDGDRSKKRKWFAEKQINTIKMLEVQSGTLKWDGFLFRQWQQGDLSGGSVTAPMGLVALCSTSNGVQKAMAEHYVGGVTSLSNVKAIGYAPANTEKPAIRVFNSASEEDFDKYGFNIFEYKPEQQTSVYDVNTTVTAGYFDIDANREATRYDDLPCTPNVFPYMTSEALWFTLTDRAEYPDPDPADGYGYSKYLFEHSLLFYISDNSNKAGRISTVAHEDWHWWKPTGSIRPDARLWSVSQRINKDKITLIYSGPTYHYPYDNNDVIVTWSITNPGEGTLTQSVSRTTLAELVPEGHMPTDLRNKLVFLNGMYDATYGCGQAGTYCFEIDGVESILHGVCTETDHSSAYPSVLGQYFDDNPSTTKWCLFYVLRVGGISHVINSDDFFSILDDLSSYDLDSETSFSPLYNASGWQLAAEVFRYIMMVPPNNYNSVFPYDSYMFHSHDGSVFSWTRRFGAFKFATSGLTREPGLNIPSEVLSEDGVQPKISYSGTYSENPHYLCICDKVGEEIKAIYHGSPFDSWTKLPNPEEAALLSVTPVKVSPLEVKLIGVIKKVIDDEDVYYSAYLYVTEAEEASWIALGRLPFLIEAGAKAMFSISLFGNGQAVKDLIEYPTPSGATPQIPVGPYNLYNSVL